MILFNFQRPSRAALVLLAFVVGIPAYPSNANAQNGPRIEWSCTADKAYQGVIPLSMQVYDGRRIYLGYASVSNGDGVSHAVIADAVVERRRSFGGAAAGICSLGFAVKDRRGGGDQMQARVSSGPACDLTLAEGRPVGVDGVRVIGGAVNANPQFNCQARVFFR